MSWLNEWMREVIMVVLLATFVDLILPSRSMERYVKLVLSLLILLTLLQPIINLFTDAPELKLSAAFKEQELNSVNFTNGKETTLQQILSQAEKLKNQQQAQSLQWAGEEVARQMKQQILENTGTQVQEVKVILGMLPSKKTDVQDIPYITSVDVVLQQEPLKNEEQGRSDDTSQEIAIAPIAPVKVEVKVEAVDTKRSPSDEKERLSNKGSTEVLGQGMEKADDIIKLLRTNWNLQPDQIQIQGNEEDGKV